LDPLTALLRGLGRSAEDQDKISAALQALDARYDLSRKIEGEPGLQEIVVQLAGRIYRAYGAFSALKGQRILDLACGSSTSKAPSFLYEDTPFGEQRIPLPAARGYTAQFEPWFCRILLELGADPVGVDIGSLDSESFEHYRVDLGQPGALDFLPARSFDAVQDSRLFGSPEFTAQFPAQAERLKVAAELVRQERRVLKAGGIVIHSDAAGLVG
jgi:hypothetical protein